MLALGFCEMKILAICISLFLLAQGLITAILVEKGYFKDTQANDFLVIGTVSLGIIGLVATVLLINGGVR